MYCFALQVNLWLWTNTAKGLPVNHALADLLNQNGGDTINSLVNHQNNVRFESKRYFPRYKTFASYPNFDIRSRTPFKSLRERAPAFPPTTEPTLLSFILPEDTNVFSNVEASSVKVDPTFSSLDYPSSTVPTTETFADVISMKMSTSMIQAHRRPLDMTKYPVEQRTAETSTVVLDPEENVPSKVTNYARGYLNRGLQQPSYRYGSKYTIETSSVTSPTLGIIAYYNAENSGATTEVATTTAAALVNENDLTKTRNYYSYQEIETQTRTESYPEQTNQNTNNEQAEESKVVTTRVYQEPQHVPTPEAVYGKPEENYEVSEEDSVRSNGRIHGVQTTTTSAAAAVSTETTQGEQSNADADRRKSSSYVVEGRNYKKYRVEEETSDGFIVGEYGILSHNDGSMRGVRYTAESNINPRLIYHALLKFLSLQ